MDLRTFLGGSPLAVFVRLALISLAVGIVLSLLGIDIRNFFDRIDVLLRNLYDLGWGAIKWALEYMILGALVVVPIWLIARLTGVFRRDQGT
jgi:hypothetical protein